MPAPVQHPRDPAAARDRAVDDPAVEPALLPVPVVFGSLTLPARPEHVGEARQFIARTIGDDPRADSALLLTSELVTNALLHSRSRLPGGQIVIVAVSNAAGLLVTVTDDGCDTGLPAVAAHPGDEHGNGLLLVETIADSWGYLRSDGHTTVWFRLCPSERAPDGRGAGRWLVREHDPPPPTAVSGAATSARAFRGMLASPRARREAGWSPPSPRPHAHTPSADRDRSARTVPASRFPCSPPIPW